MFFFFIINKIYNKEFTKKQNEIDKLLSNNNSNLKNEKDIYKLFKINYIKKNILENDYNKLKLNFKKFVPEDFIKSISK
jgi:hypothetical protein